jgi:uncharacterized membrane protein YccC
VKRATRWTRFAHRAIGVSVAAALVVAAVPLVHKRPDAVSLRLATGDLRSRAAEAALAAQAWDEHRATGEFTRMQAEQLAHAVGRARREVADAPAGLEQAAGVVTTAADTLLLALRDLERLPAPDDGSPRAKALRATSDSLHAIERALSAQE